MRPTLVIAGDRDADINLDHTVDLYKSLPRGQLMVVPAATHMVRWKEPAIVNAAVLAFLAEKTARIEDNPLQR